MKADDDIPEGPDDTEMWKRQNIVEKAKDIIEEEAREKYGIENVAVNDEARGMAILLDEDDFRRWVQDKYLIDHMVRSIQTSTEKSPDNSIHTADMFKENKGMEEE